jgi:hypothetical protein
MPTGLALPQTDVSQTIYPWRAVAELLGLSPCIAPSSLPLLGHGACGVVFGSERLAFKMTCFRWHTEDAERVLKEARLYFQLQQKEQQQTEDGVSRPSLRSFMPHLHFAGFVDFSDVPHIHCRFRWQFVQVMSREGDSLATTAVRQSASARPAHECHCLTCAAVQSLRKLHHMNCCTATRVRPISSSRPRRARLSIHPCPRRPLRCRLLLQQLTPQLTSQPAAASASSSAAAAPVVRIIDLSHAGEMTFSEERAEDEIQEAEGELDELRSADCLRHRVFGQ